MTELVRIAAVGDLHCTKTSEGAFQSLFAEMIECANVIALAGDLVDYGLPEEAHVLARELGVALKAKVAFAVFGASKSAVAAVEKAGGSVLVLAPKEDEPEKAA